MYNKGQVFHSDPGVQLRVEGAFENDSSALSDNNGILVIDSSFYNFHNSKQQGNGAYYVSANWVNSAHFARDTSIVHLWGMTEYIEGDSTTNFYNLSCEGGGRKVMKVNTFVYNYLNLHNLELATNEDTLYIENPSTSAIQSSTIYGKEGFISTLDTGCLVRKTNSTGIYYFPFGSIIGTNRFRPVNLSPDAGTINQYALSFQNKKGDLDRYLTANTDTDVCKVNPLFYHTINRIQGTTSTDIYIGYIAAEDGVWTEISNWNSSKNKWINTGIGGGAKINAYNAVERPTWNTFTDKPYALENFKPHIDSLSGSTLLCNSSPVNSIAYTDNLGSYIYSWSSSGGSFNGDSTGSNVSVKFTSVGTQKIGLTIIDTSTGCSSGRFSKNLNVSKGPKAGFSISYLNLFENTPISFKDSSLGANTWVWNFGNGYTSSVQNPQTAYSNGGGYTIKQIVMDSIGCKDSTERSLLISCSLKVPTIFSPNGDGENDVFLIEGLCITNYTLEIMDRWGLLVYKGAEGSLAWDGRTPSGQGCPEGTYFYTLEANVGGIIQNNKGFVTLVR